MSSSFRCPMWGGVWHHVAAAVAWKPKFRAPHPHWWDFKSTGAMEVIPTASLVGGLEHVLFFHMYIYIYVYNIYLYIGNNHPNWLMFFRGVEATNQIPYIDRFWFGSVQHGDLWGKARICWPYKCYAGELLHIWRIRICFLSWLLSGQVLLFRSWYPNYLVPFKVP